MNEVYNLQKFINAKLIAEDNDIELMISNNEIIIQKEHELFRAKSIDECFGFIIGFIHKKR